MDTRPTREVFRDQLQTELRAHAESVEPRLDQLDAGMTRLTTEVDRLGHEMAVFRDTIQGGQDDIEQSINAGRDSFEQGFGFKHSDARQRVIAFFDREILVTNSALFVLLIGVLMLLLQSFGLVGLHP